MMRAQSAEGRAPRPIRSSALRALCSALSFNRDRIAIGLIVLLFLSIRVPLLIVREPFFDELATVVFARAPISELWAMLQQDSASPLYLGFSRLIESIGAFTVRSGRLLSLAFASLTLLGLLTYRAHRARQAALIGAALLAVFLPHAYFSTEARAYALAALLIGIATLALYRFLESRRTTWLAIATASAVLAAYSHAYGVLFFPSLAVLSFCTRDHRIVAKGILASLAAAVLFIPGFLLARSQPVDSIAWMDPGSFSERVSLVLGTIQQFGFAAPFPTLFGPPLIPWLRIVSMIVVGAIAVWGLWKSTDARFFGLMLLIPITGVFAFALTGRMFYFPGRFESVWSVPFVMLLGSGLVAFPQRARPFLVATLVGLGTAVCSIAIADHVNRQPDPFRRVSQLVRRNVDPGTTIVASGYMYLELLSQTDARWRPRIIAFPAEQAHHPGWAAKPSPDQLQLEIPSLPDQILWVGLRDTPEEKIIGENFNLRLMTAEGPVVASLGAK